MKILPLPHLKCGTPRKLSNSLGALIIDFIYYMECFAGQKTNLITEPLNNIKKHAQNSVCGQNLSSYKQTTDQSFTLHFHRPVGELTLVPVQPG